MDPIIHFGIQLIQLFQTLSPALDLPMKAASFLGTIEFYIVLIPALYWIVDVKIGIRALLLLIGTDFVGLSIKQILRQPRPYWVGGVKPLGTETTYGFPSAHSNVSLTVWGFLAYRFKKDWLWAIAIFLVLAIGFSRMYLGVHFPQDMLGGWSIGLAAVVIFTRREKQISAWFNGLSTTTQIAAGFGISLVMILLGVLIHLLIAAVPDPVEWASFATQARKISDFFTLGGALFGAVAGYVWMREHACFQVKGPGWQQVARYFVGIAGVLIFYLALDLLFSLIAEDETLAGYLLRYIRYATVTFWVTFGAPWAFLKLRLAEAA